MGAGALRRGGVRGAIAAALVVLLLLALPAVGRGADTFVDDDTGSNANACTSSGAPCFTIGGGTGGIAKAGTNDTVRVDGGTYNEVLTLSNGKSLIEQNFNTGAGDSQARIDGGAAVAITVPLGGSAGTIDGFDLTSDVTVVLL